MPPSWSAIERADPPPRRKSCAACIKAKRRCSQDVPLCQRCQQRNLECQYPVRRAPRSRRTEDSPPDSFVDLAIPTPGTTVAGWIPANDTSGFEVSRLFASPDAATHTAPTTPPSSSSSAGDTPGLEDSLPTPGADQFPHPPPGRNPLAGLSHDSAFLAVSPPKPVQSMAEISDQVAFAMKARLQYALDKISFAVNQMVLECSNPWSHPHLYYREMPRSIQDAQAFSALYISKTPANSLIVLRMIESRAQELVASPIPATGLEVLARAQSLLLYQIIRFFDGDISLRAGAERGMCSMEEAAFSLMAFTTFSIGTFEDVGLGLPGGPLPAAPGPDVPIHDLPSQELRAFWESWVFQESARRTFLMMFFFLRIYAITKGEFGANPKPRCDGRLGLCHSFTLSAHLWAAKDFVDFAPAWKTKRHFVVKNGNYSEVIADAQAEDLDVYGKIFLSAVVGIDEAKRWLMLRGGEL